jgi:hypothetical protein
MGRSDRHWFAASNRFTVTFAIGYGIPINIIRTIEERRPVAFPVRRSEIKGQHLIKCINVGDVVLLFILRFGSGRA